MIWFSCHTLSVNACLTMPLESVWRISTFLEWSCFDLPFYDLRRTWPLGWPPVCLNHHFLLLFDHIWLTAFLCFWLTSAGHVTSFCDLQLWKNKLHSHKSDRVAQLFLLTQLINDSIITQKGSDLSLAGTHELLPSRGRSKLRPSSGQ